MKKSIKLLTVGVALGTGVLANTGCGHGSASKNDVTLAELNRALVVMAMSQADTPQTVDGLTNFPAFKGRPFPVPPAGKQFAIDPATRQIVVVDK
jgi:hypothetical protein